MPVKLDSRKKLRVETMLHIHDYKVKTMNTYIPGDSTGRQAVTCMSKRTKGKKNTGSSSQERGSTECIK